MSPKLRVEFHCHSIYSKDSLTGLDEILTTCEARGIDRVLISDHNTIAGALRAKEMDPQRVIVGEEIMTREGELLAAFVQEEVPRGLSPLEAIERLRSQGAFISVSHPFDRLRPGSWQREALLEITPLVDAIEVYNARCFPLSYNDEAQAFAYLENIPGTAGSDAHAAFEIGKATMLLPTFEDADGLRAVIEQAEFEVRPSGPWVRLASRWAKVKKRLGLASVP